MTLSASSLPRVFRCLASAAHQSADFTTKAAIDGTARHADQEAAIKAGDLTCLPDTLAAMLDGMDVRSEVALAYNWSTDTARIIGYNIDRNYGQLDALEIPGTADLIAVGNGRVIVADKKGYKLVEHPRDNKQTLHNALCAARIWNVDEVTVCTHDEIREPQFATLDLFDLEAFANDLRNLHVRLAEARRNPAAFEVEGSHCEYCPAFEACSRKNRLVALVESGAVEKRLGKALNMGDDETARDVYFFRQKLYALLKRLDSRVYARAAERPIPLGNGKAFGRQLKPGNRSLDADKVEAAIRELFPDKADVLIAETIERSVTQEALEGAARKHMGKGKIESTKQRILSRTEELGGITRKPTEQWGEFDDFAARPVLKAANDG